MADTPPLCPIYDTKDGWSIMTIRWSVVPHYDYEAACKGLSQQGIQREIEVNWNATTGKLVYPDFRYETHVALNPIRWSGETLYCGWDLAHLGCPAFVPSFVNSFGQWCLLPGVCPLEDETVDVYQFGKLVADYLTNTFAAPKNLRLDELPLVHYGDPQGNARPQRNRTGDKQELRSAFDIIRRGMEVPAGEDRDGETLYTKLPGWGWVIQGGGISNHERQSAVTARLVTMLRGLPSVLVCPNATVLTEGFNGKYCFPERADGTYGDAPDKNWWSHSMNAVEYCATRLFAFPREEDEEEAMPQRLVRSRAAGRDN